MNYIRLYAFVIMAVTGFLHLHVICVRCQELEKLFYLIIILYEKANGICHFF